jgi:uncharacterized membrane protein
MTELEQADLIAENESLKSDLRQIKEVTYRVCGVLGVVDENRQIKKDFSIKDIAGILGDIFQEALMPKAVTQVSDKVKSMLGMSTEKKQSTMQQLMFVTELLPLIEKYKNL